MCYMIYGICYTLYITRYISYAYTRYINPVCVWCIQHMILLVYPPSIEPQRMRHETLSSPEVLKAHRNPKPHEIQDTEES